MTPRPSDGGAASVWVVAACALVLVVSYAGVLRTTAVLARHRAESAADLAALAAAGQIGVGTDPCRAASANAAANAATISACQPRVAADGRTGTVLVRVVCPVVLPIVGARQVMASARAGRLAVPP